MESVTILVKLYEEMLVVNVGSGQQQLDMSLKSHNAKDP